MRVTIRKIELVPPPPPNRQPAMQRLDAYRRFVHVAMPLVPHFCKFYLASMTVTAQYISREWEYHNYVLSTKEMKGSHTADILAEDFDAVLGDWCLSGKKVGLSVTTDNAANTSLAMKKSAASPIHIRCMAPTLNISTEKALEIPGFVERSAVW